MRTSFLRDLIPFLSSAFRGGGSKWITAQVCYPHADLAKAMSSWSIYSVHGRALDASEGLSAAPLPRAAATRRAFSWCCPGKRSLPALFPRTAAQEFCYSCRDCCRQHRKISSCFDYSMGCFLSGTLLLAVPRVVTSSAGNTRVPGKPQAWRAAGASGCVSPEELHAVRPRSDAAWHSFPEHRAWRPWELVPTPDPVPDLTGSRRRPGAVPVPLAPLHTPLWSPWLPTL